MALVWYSSWQMECCGEPFGVGDLVEWSLAERVDADWLEEVIGSELAAQVTHHEDHHDVEEDAVVGKGIVRSIRCAYCKMAPRSADHPRTLYPVTGTAKITSAQRVDGTEGSARGDLRFSGYVVELDLNLD